MSLFILYFKQIKDSLNESECKDAIGEGPTFERQQNFHSNIDTVNENEDKDSIDGVCQVSRLLLVALVAGFIKS